MACMDVQGHHGPGASYHVSLGVSWIRSEYGAANQATEAEVAGLVTVLQEALAELT